jgi:hypothetical protein
VLDRCSRFRRSSSAGVDELATPIVRRSVARRVRTATIEADELEREILAHVRALTRRHCPTSLASDRSSPPT